MLEITLRNKFILLIEPKLVMFSHTECILSATRQCNSTLLTYMYLSTMITELGSTTGKKNYPNLDTLLENSRQYLTKGWEGGKTVALSSKKRKTESHDRAQN